MFTYRTGSKKGQHSENLHYNDKTLDRLSSEIDLEGIVLKDIKSIEDVLDLHKKSINLMNKTVSDPDMSTIEGENQFKRKPLSSARSNNDVSSTPTPTPRRSVAVANPRYLRSRSAGQVWTGGAQIVFNDVETLTQKSPEKSPKSRPMTRRSSKRSLEEQQQLASVGSRVAAFEKRQKRFR
jgi:hypothetical protein